MRGATRCNRFCLQVFNISIHTPHAGSDFFQSQSVSSNGLFQSTLPMRGATTLLSIPNIPTYGFQSTLPMRGATHYFKLYFDRLVISIHTPHAGSDNPMHSPTTTVVRFQSTLPMRGATHTPSSSLLFGSIFQSTLPMRGAT